jgi:hypothetical protein
MIGPLGAPLVPVNDGKALMNSDLAEIQYTPLPVRSPHGHRVDSFTLKACIDSLHR